MRAIRQHAIGGPEELRLEEVPGPHPAGDQVRIRVESAGVHLLDTVIRQGGGGPRVAPRLPMTPGREVAGTIDEVGADTDTADRPRFALADAPAAHTALQSRATTGKTVLRP